jgi:hypothetical protein
MRVLPGKFDIPDELVQDVADGNVVFLCGAGVSMRVNLPSFKQLAAQIYADIGENLGSQMF